MKKSGLLVLVMLGFAQVSSTAENYSKMSANELNEALIKAVKKGSSEEVQKLVQAGANVDQTISCIETMGDCDYDITRTVLEYAAKEGYVDVVKELKVKAKNDDINAALILAAKEGHPNVVRELVQAKPKVDTLNKALLAAAHECHTNVIKELIKAGACVNHANEYGNTALMEVINYPFYTETYYKHRDKKYRAEAIQDLIKAKANVNHANKEGDTALIRAIRNHDFDDVQILLQTPGINLHHVNKNGDTAINLLKKIDEKMNY